MTRFFVRPDQIAGDFVTLDPEDSLHLDRVLRAKVGDEIAVLDGSGTIYSAALTSVAKSCVVAQIASRQELKSEPMVKVVIAQALPKTADKLEWALQHGVEVGASGFWIFRSQRSEAGKLAEKPERWVKIVKTAAEQSGRARLPEVASYPSLAAIAAQAKEFDLTVLCDEASQDKPGSFRRKLLERNPSTVLAIIGPEGGWSDDERSLLRDHGVESISLGRRILRTETAALVAISQILFALDAD